MTFLSTNPDSANLFFQLVKIDPTNDLDAIKRAYRKTALDYKTTAIKVMPCDNLSSEGSQVDNNPKMKQLTVLYHSVTSKLSIDAACEEVNRRKTWTPDWEDLTESSFVNLDIHTLLNVFKQLTDKSLGTLCTTLVERCSSLFETMSDLANFLQTLPTEEQRAVVCNAWCADILPPLIKKPDDLSVILCLFTVDRCSVICKALKYYLPSLFETARDLAGFLQTLPTEEQRTVVFEVYKDNLVSLIQNPDDLLSVCQCLTDHQSEIICTSLKDCFPVIFKTESDFSNFFLKHCTEYERVFLANLYKEQLLSLFFDDEELFSESFKYSIPKTEISALQSIIFGASADVELTESPKNVDQHQLNAEEPKTTPSIAPLQIIGGNSDSDEQLKQLLRSFVEKAQQINKKSQSVTRGFTGLFFRNISQKKAKALHNIFNTAEDAQQIITRRLSEGNPNKHDDVKAALATLRNTIDNNMCVLELYRGIFTGKTTSDPLARELNEKTSELAKHFL